MPKQKPTERARKAGSPEWPHLRRCKAWHQVYEGLLSAAQGLYARNVCEVTGVRMPAAGDGCGSGPCNKAILCLRWAASSGLAPVTWH